jgi:hypothetical protein
MKMKNLDYKKILLIAISFPSFANLGILIVILSGSVGYSTVALIFLIIWALIHLVLLYVINIVPRYIVITEDYISIKYLISKKVIKINNISYIKYKRENKQITIAVGRKTTEIYSFEPGIDHDEMIRILQSLISSKLVQIE